MSYDAHKASVQQAMAQQAMLQGLGAGLGQFNPNGDYNITKQEKIRQLQAIISKNQADLERLILDEPLDSPTQRMLNSSEALQNAWNEFNVIWKLTGKNTK